ncbi:MAG: AAA family ATPase [Candidatus Promineifilaceae bacterium]|nr:AAA family ATPase [Candidatus Promineifilaceae bacterium]
MPFFIQQQYAAGQVEGTFDGAALFVDISGFTTITDAIMDHGQHGAEVLTHLLADLFDPLIEGVFAQGGFVTSLAGDAFTAVFPADDGPPAARALAAAWQVRQGLGASSISHTEYGDFDLSVKIGLALGEISWGIVTSANGQRAAYFFQGAAIEEAAAAEKLARPGQVILTERVREALDPLATTDPTGEHWRASALQGPLPAPRPIQLPPPDPTIQGRFFPPQAWRSAAVGEFRQLVSLFVSLPTVQTAAQLDTFMQGVFALQDRYGGLLNRLDFGDKGANLLLFWGAPLAFEDDIRRALSFILELQTQTVIPIKAGLSYGIAHAGYSGGALAGEYTGHGRVTTLAARLMEAAPRGEVWVDQRIVKRAERAFDFDPEGELDFKGFTAPQSVFVLLERKEESEYTYPTAMVGRQTELAHLTDFVEPVWQGRYAGLCLVRGEPGVGKSRLVHAFWDSLKASAPAPFAVHIGQTDAILRESFNPFRYWLRRYFGQSEQQSEARNKRSFNRLLDRLRSAVANPTLAAELDRTRSFLGALVNLNWPDSLYEQLDGQARYENTMLALQTLLQAESQRQPLLLILEDIQWLDADSQTFLTRLTQSLESEPDYPLAVLATARPEGDRAWLDDLRSFQEIHLERLAASDLAALAAAQLDGPPSSRLLTLLQERSGGNALFAEQILRYLRDRGLLVQEKEHWNVVASQAAVLPADVRALLVASLDQLTDQVKAVVQGAAVLGREFEVRLLDRMLQQENAVRACVAAAERLAIWSALSELRYIFRHGLLRDAAYHMQARTSRQALHRLAVEALEALHDGELVPYYGELAYHCERARLDDKARHYLELAGAAAAEAYQNHLAADYFQRALNLTPADDHDARYRLLAAREALSDLLGNRDEQAQHLSEMSALADTADRQVEVLIRQAWRGFWTGEYQTSLDHSKRAIELADQCGETTLAGRAHYVRWWVLLTLGNLTDSNRQARAALEAARQAGDRAGEANAHNALGMLGIAEGNYFSSRQHLLTFLRLARQLKNREREHTALLNLGIVSTVLGDYQQARRYYQQSLDVGREIGHWVSMGSLYVNLSWVAGSLGEWETALEWGQRGLERKRQARHPEAEAEALLWLAHAWTALGEFEQAEDAYRHSLETRRELGQENLAMGVLAGLARLALAQDDLAAASRYADEILAYLDGGGSLGATWEPLRITWSCCLVLQARGDPRAALFLETTYRELMTRAERIPDPATRTGYLEKVPWHRDIVRAHEQQTGRS